MPARRTTPGFGFSYRIRPLAAQHCVLVPERKQFSILRQVLTEYQDGQTEYPANQQVDDLEQHPASQPSPLWMRAKAQVSRSIDYSSGTGRSRPGPWTDLTS